MFFFALRADGKGVFLCIYLMKERGELGGEWAGSGLCVEGLKEIGRRKGCCTKYLKLQFMRSRNRERDLAYVAWKGGAWGIGRRKGCFQINSRLYPLFVACSPE